MSALAVLVEAVFSCGFYSALVGFSAAVPEEYRIIACCIAEFFCKFSLNLSVVVVAGMLESTHLSAHSVSPLFIAVSEAIAADTASEVDIFLVVFINALSVLSRFHCEGITSIRMCHMIIEFINCFFITVHLNFLLRDRGCTASHTIIITPDCP